MTLMKEIRNWVQGRDLDKFDMLLKRRQVNHIIKNCFFCSVHCNLIACHFHNIVLLVTEYLLKDQIKTDS